MDAYITAQITLNDPHAPSAVSLKSLLAESMRKAITNPGEQAVEVTAMSIDPEMTRIGLIEQVTLDVHHPYDAIETIKELLDMNKDDLMRVEGFDEYGEIRFKEQKADPLTIEGSDTELPEGCFIAPKSPTEGALLGVLVTPLYADMNDDITAYVTVTAMDEAVGEVFTFESYLVRDNLVVPDNFDLIPAKEIFALDNVLKITQRDAPEEIKTQGEPELMPI